MTVATVCYPVKRPKSFEMFKGTVMQIEKGLINAFQLFIIMQESYSLTVYIVFSVYKQNFAAQ